MDTIKFEKDTFLFSHKKSCESHSYRDLIAIEYQKPYVVLQIGRKSVIFQNSLYIILEKLPIEFILVNRGTIVNIEHVVGITFCNKVHCIQMDNDKVYKISIRRVSTIKKAFMLKRTGEII